jgi:hypothetical protein
MDDDQFQVLTDALSKLGDCQVKTLIDLKKLQALVLAQQTLLQNLMSAQGFSLEQVSELTTKLMDEGSQALDDSLWDWLSKHGIADLSKENAWWDRPPPEE